MEYPALNQFDRFSQHSALTPLVVEAIPLEARGLGCALTKRYPGCSWAFQEA